MTKKLKRTVNPTPSSREGRDETGDDVSFFPEIMGQLCIESSDPAGGYTIVPKGLSVGQSEVLKGFEQGKLANFRIGSTPLRPLNPNYMIELMQEFYDRFPKTIKRLGEYPDPMPPIDILRDSRPITADEVVRTHYQKTNNWFSWFRG